MQTHFSRLVRDLFITQIVGISEVTSVTKVVKGCLRTTKVAIFVVYCHQTIEKVTWLPFHKELLAKNEKYGILSI